MNNRIRRNVSPQRSFPTAIEAVKPKQRNVDQRDLLIVAGLAVAILLALLAGRASAQDETPASSVDVAVMEFGAVKPVEPTLKDKFNATLDRINGFIFKTLFFDVSFGVFLGEATDENGNTKYQEEPVSINLPAARKVVELDAKLNPVKDKAGNLQFFEAEADLAAYKLDENQQPIKQVTDKPVIEGAKAPFLVVFLGFGAVFYTIFHGFINIKGFKHAVEIVSGKWSAGDDTGDISPFRALTSALSATVGLGNIAGVAVAMVTGGPGALFWMMVLGLFGMTSKFHETTLSQMFRVKNEDGSMSGGPMYFLDKGLKQIHPLLGTFGKILAIVFAVFLMGAALGGGNMFQSNQAFEGFFGQFVQPYVGVEEVDNVRQYASYGFGLVMAAMVGVVVIGGITRIGVATSVIVPFMAMLYVIACLVIIFSNISLVPGLIVEIFQKAWAPEAGLGGVIGAMMVGFQRAAFSSEAGIGSSAIAHSAAKTDEPVREGLVASLEPFVDTIVICFMTGMTVLITGAYQAEGVAGAGVTLYAFEQKDLLVTLKFPWILAISIILFAFSTMISWCYYGERAWGYIFGLKSVIVFRLAFVVCVFIGAVASLGSVIDSADAMLLSCALPNILGGIILAPLVKRRLKEYWSRYKSGEMKPGQPLTPMPGEEGEGI